jgi:N-acetylmuramoyl-L-alanine amidase
MKMRSLLMMIVVIVLMCGCKKEEKVTEVKINEQPSASPIAEVSSTPVATTAAATTEPTKQPEATQNTASGVSLIEAKNASSYTIAIDAGHQAKGMSEQEPIGPGATETKPKVSSGTTGVASKVPEYKVTLQVSLLLRDLLKSKGYNVVMIRETHDVTISNSERAQVANNANAHAFIRIHCNGAADSSAKGALTMCQTKNNKYCGQLYSKSRSLSDKVVAKLCEATGARNKGVLESDTMSGINWCSVPVTIVEMGFMSNPEEDRLLVDANYQNKLAVGIANGVIEYLNGQ